MNTDLIFFLTMLALAALFCLAWMGINLYDWIKTAINKRKKDVLSEEIQLF